MQSVFFVLGGVELALSALWPEHMPQSVNLLVYIAGVSTILYGVLGWESGLFVQWIGHWRFAKAGSVVPFRRVVPFQKAAQLAYEKTLGTNAAKFAERPLGGSEPDVLGWYSYALLGTSNDAVGVYGKRPPSESLEQIPAEKFKQFWLSDDLNSVHYYGKKNPEYIDLYVTARDLRKRVKAIKKW